jgi:hypothetical protein
VIDLDRVRPGDRLLTRDLVWRTVAHIHICGERYRIVFADAPWRFSYFDRVDRDIAAVRFVAVDRDEPLMVLPPEREIAFQSGEGMWLLDKIRRGIQ